MPVGNFSLRQYIFARDWPMKLFLWLVPVLAAVGALGACQPTAAMFRDWRYVTLLIVCVLLAIILGFFLSLPLAWILLSPSYHAQGLRNGAPFHPGDRVRILAGPHRGRIVEVREVWAFRSQIRVEIDAKATEDATDEFSPTEICREKEPPINEMQNLSSA
jgi:hypothetical protein